MLFKISNTWCLCQWTAKLRFFFSLPPPPPPNFCFFFNLAIENIVLCQFKKGMKLYRLEKHLQREMSFPFPRIFNLYFYNHCLYYGSNHELLLYPITTLPNPIPSQRDVIDSYNISSVKPCSPRHVVILFNLAFLLYPVAIIRSWGRMLINCLFEWKEKDENLCNRKTFLFEIHPQSM